MTTDHTSATRGADLPFGPATFARQVVAPTREASTTNLRITLPIPFYIGRLPTYNWASISIVLGSL